MLTLLEKQFFENQEQFQNFVKNPQQKVSV